MKSKYFSSVFVYLDRFHIVQGDPTYLVVEKDRTLATYGINAVCTHLGCVVPWNQAENKFICPCHGSQYNDQGRVVRGPAPLVSFFPYVSYNMVKIYSITLRFLGIYRLAYCLQCLLELVCLLTMSVKFDTYSSSHPVIMF